MIDVFTHQHDGRTLRRYSQGENAGVAVREFHQRHPDMVIRTVWEFVPPDYYTEPSTQDQPADQPPLFTDETEEQS